MPALTEQQTHAAAQIIYADTEAIKRQLDALIRARYADPDMRAHYELAAHWIKDLRELADSMTAQPGASPCQL